jgi:hypothetical protein
LSLLNDENDVPEDGDQEAECALSGAAIWKHEDADDGALFHFVPSILIKMDRSSLVNHDLLPGTHIEGII